MASPTSSKRCHVRDNARPDLPGKYVLVPDTLSELYAAVEERLGLTGVTRLFGESGAEVDAVEWVRDSEVLFAATEDAPFWRTDDSELLTRGRCTLYTEGASAEAVVVRIPRGGIEALRSIAASKLGLAVAFLFNEHGALVDDLDTVQNNDVILVCESRKGPRWQPPDVVNVVSQRVSWMDDDGDESSVGRDSDGDDSSLVVISESVPARTPRFRVGAGGSASASASASGVGAGGLPAGAGVVGGPLSGTGLSEWVMLNVGGRIFQTSRSTLCRDPDSMLARLFETRDPDSEPRRYTWNSAVDAQGAFLFDRDPEYFAPVLNFLRTGQVVIPESCSTEGVLQEAMFFQVSALCQRLQDVVDARYAIAENPLRHHYVVLTVKAGGVKLIEGPVDSVMCKLNGGQTPPRKPPFSVKADDLHTRVYGFTELGWLLKNFKLSEVLDALLEEDWVLIDSSTSFSAWSIGPASPEPTGDNYEHVFIFRQQASQPF